jgi:hypothetical protein
MPRTESGSFSSRVENWETMLRAYDLNAALLAPALPQRDALEAVLEQARDAKDAQLQHTSLKQQATKDMLRTMAAGDEAARCLRRAVEANLGTDSELLVHFELTPRRPRRRRKPATEEPAPTEPPSEEPTEPQPE